MTLEMLARIWFERSPMQHQIIVRNLIRKADRQGYNSISG